MWNLPKPSLDLSIKDLEDVKKHSCYLKDKHIPAVKDLYISYDVYNGHVDDRIHDDLDEMAQKGLSLAYLKTYRGKQHRIIAEELKNGIDKCPMCDIGNANTLDHYMEKSRYPGLAIMRQNLVPMCRDCNTIRERNKLKHDDMLHAYYDKLPEDEQWLKVELRFGAGAISAKFYPDSLVLTDPIQYHKAAETIKRLELNETIRKEISSFLSGLLYGKGDNDSVLISLLKAKSYNFKTIHDSV